MPKRREEVEAEEEAEEGRLLILAAIRDPDRAGPEKAYASLSRGNDPNETKESRNQKRYERRGSRDARLLSRYGPTQRRQAGPSFSRSLGQNFTPVTSTCAITPLSER